MSIRASVQRAAEKYRRSGLDWAEIERQRDFERFRKLGFNPNAHAFGELPPCGDCLSWTEHRNSPRCYRAVGVD